MHAEVDTHCVVGGKRGGYEKREFGCKRQIMGREGKGERKRKSQRGGHDHKPILI